MMKECSCARQYHELTAREGDWRDERKREGEKEGEIGRASCRERV